MATASVARPAVQSMRQRDRAPRPNLSKRSTNQDGSGAPAKKRKLNEPYVRDSAYILRKHKGKPPSIIIHLHNLNFRFDGQEGSFAYDSPMKMMLEHMRSSTVPHQMLEELLANNVPFYDGCLIVEVHNHKTKEGQEKGRREEGSGADGKFSMHQYNEHVTPSPAVPYPSKARTDEQPEKGEGSGGEMAAPERKGKEQDKDGPRIFTTVLHPTPLTQHTEMLLLAAMPASELRSKKKSGESGTPSSAQPPATPSMSVPPTPTVTTRGPLSQTQKMCLEEGDFYSFQADVLMATEPPLYLEPVNNPQDADKVLEMLSDPLHCAKAPSPKSRKRTTAEMAADDAQAAEAERRMLIMDERIKPSARTGAGATSNENQGAAASLGFSRFKTLEMVRQKHEEQERTRKDEEARAAVEKKHLDEQNAQHNALKQQQLAQEHRKREVLLAQQQQALSNRNLVQQKQQQLEQQRQAAQMAREHGHPQQNGMMHNPSQGNFQHPASISQGSPIATQQTPMMTSSPMMPNGGFPVAPTSSQGAGSPPRPTSAALQNRNVAMARHASQQAHGSQNNTPQMPQGTPNMAQVVPNRQMTQTPRLPPGSPAVGMHGTPTSAGVMQPTPHMGNSLTPEQVQMLRQQQIVNQQNAASHAGSPANGGQQQASMQNMTPEQFQHIRAQHQQQAMRVQQQAMLAAQAQGNPQAAQAYAQMQRQKQLQMQQLRMQQQMQQQMGQQGSPAMGMQGTPSMGHAHPSQTPHPQHQPTPQMQQNGIQMQQNGQPATAEQIAMAQAKGTQMALQRQQQTQLQLQQAGQQYGGWQNIPQNIVASLPPNVQGMYLQQQQKMAQNRARQQQQARAQQMAAHQAGGGGGGEGQVVGGQPNPGYMQQLRTNRDLLQAQLQMQSQQQNGQAAAMQGLAGMGMGGQQPPANFGNGGGGGPDHLNQHFANMHNALNQPQQQQQQRGPQQ